MAGLKVPDKKYVGRFRGEPGLETTRVWVGEEAGGSSSRPSTSLFPLALGKFVHPVGILVNGEDKGQRVRGLVAANFRNRPGGLC